MGGTGRASDKLSGCSIEPAEGVMARHRPGDAVVGHTLEPSAYLLQSVEARRQWCANEIENVLPVKWCKVFVRWLVEGPGREFGCSLVDNHQVLSHWGLITPTPLHPPPYARKKGIYVCVKQAAALHSSSRRETVVGVPSPLLIVYNGTKLIVAAA